MKEAWRKSYIYVCFDLYSFVEKEKTMGTKGRWVIARDQGKEVGYDHKGSQKRLIKVREILHILIVRVATSLYMFVKPCQTVYWQGINFIAYKLSLSEPDLFLTDMDMNRKLFLKTDYV